MLSCWKSRDDEEYEPLYPYVQPPQRGQQKMLKVAMLSGIVCIAVTAVLVVVILNVTSVATVASNDTTGPVLLRATGDLTGSNWNITGSTGQKVIVVVKTEEDYDFQKVVTASPVLNGTNLPKSEIQSIRGEIIKSWSGSPGKASAKTQTPAFTSKCTLPPLPPALNGKPKVAIATEVTKISNETRAIPSKPDISVVTQAPASISKAKASSASVSIETIASITSTAEKEIIPSWTSIDADDGAVPELKISTPTPVDKSNRKESTVIKPTTHEIGDISWENGTEIFPAATGKVSTASPIHTPKEKPERAIAPSTNDATGTSDNSSGRAHADESRAARKPSTATPVTESNETSATSIAASASKDASESKPPSASKDASESKPPSASKDSAESKPPSASKDASESKPPSASKDASESKPPSASKDASESIPVSESKHASAASISASASKDVSAAAIPGSASKDASPADTAASSKDASPEVIPPSTSEDAAESIPPSASKHASAAATPASASKDASVAAVIPVSESKDASPAAIPPSVSQDASKSIPASASKHASAPAIPSSESKDASTAATPSSASKDTSASAIPASASKDPSPAAIPSSASKDASAAAIPASASKDASSAAIPPSASKDASTAALPASASKDASSISSEAGVPRSVSKDASSIPSEAGVPGSVSKDALAVAVESKNTSTISSTIKIEIVIPASAPSPKSATTTSTPLPGLTVPPSKEVPSASKPQPVEHVLVDLKLGRLRGIKQKSRGGRDFMAFLGVPYAKPPLGDLRFRNSVKVEPWDNILNATSVKPECIQRDKYNPVLVTKGVEDCLFLNIYTPKKLDELGSRRNRFPVMFYIHGGGPFGNGSRYRGDYFMDEDVIFITVQYRLGVLGNLNTNDTAAHGNQGLKDQVLALQWIQDNIQYFGGNRRKVTLFGNSYGSMEVHSHVFSPMSKRLFHRIICQSGVTLFPGMLNENPLKTATNLGHKVNCTQSNTSELVNCLRNVPVQELILTSFNDPFIISIEPPSRDRHHDIFLPGHPFQLLQNGEFKKVPAIFGDNSAEALLSSLTYLMNDTFIAELNENFADGILVPLKLDITASNPKAIALAAKEFYFGNATISRENEKNFTDLFSDRIYNHPTTVAAAYQSRHNGRRDQVFLYYFAKQVAKKYTKGVEELYKPDHFLGASHADEIQLLFPYDDFPFVELDSEYGELSRTMVKLWVSFAQDGKPSGAGNKWLPINANKKPYRFFELSDNPRMVEPFGERMKFWDSFNLTDLYVSKDPLNPRLVH